MVVYKTTEFLPLQGPGVILEQYTPVSLDTTRNGQQGDKGQFKNYVTLFKKTYTPPS